MLHLDPQYHGFYMQPKGPQVNQPSFADDVIIFTSGKKCTLKLIIKTLATYEKVSGQLINRNKSHFLVPDNTFKATV